MGPSFLDYIIFCFLVWSVQLFHPTVYFLTVRFFVLIAMLSFTISRHFGIPLRYLLVVLLHISCTLSTSICYNRNSVQVDGWLPCAPDVDNGPCCPLGWICLSNGLCQPTPSSLNHHDISYFRPHCTDPSWNTTSCFSGCNSGMS